MWEHINLTKEIFTKGQTEEGQQPGLEILETFQQWKNTETKFL